MQASHKMSFGLMHIHQGQMFRDVTLSFHLSDYQLQQLYTLPNQISFLRYQKVFCTKSYKNVQNKILVLMKDYVRFSHFARKNFCFFHYWIFNSTTKFEPKKSKTQHNSFYVPTKIDVLIMLIFAFTLIFCVIDDIIIFLFNTA